jgi:hypothetical protein
MKKAAILSWIFLISSRLFSQNIDALAKAEKDFEKTCLQKGIRDGFLSWLDSNAIEFSDKGPVNSKELWSSFPNFDGVFTWSPSYAEMSLSGDWGYTTGNYMHRPKLLSDPVNEYGQYTTIWHRLPDGQWKYLIDMGNKHSLQSLEKQAVKIETKKTSSVKNGVEKKVLEQENAFIRSFDENMARSYQEMGSNHYILNITGRTPVLSQDSAIAILKSYPSLHYQPAGAKISPASDLAAVYGTFILNGQIKSYLRIWRHEEKAWKIALEVIRI